MRIRFSGLVLAALALFLGYWYRLYLTDAPIPAVDLPGHIALAERLAEQLRRGHLFFYDPAWFTGWPAFQFYPFLPHLLAALLSYPLHAFSDEPARLAVHLLLLVGVALLAISIVYATRPFTNDIIGDQAKLRESLRLLEAVLAGTLTFWFLNRSGAEFYGVGAAAVMQMGLYGQLFGWHLALVHLGALGRLLSGNPRGSQLPLALSAVLLVLTHTLTAAFSFALAGLAWLRFSAARRPIVCAHLAAFGLASFWLVPAILLSPRYTILQVDPWQGDVLHLLFRYPAVQLWRAAVGWRHGGFTPIDPTPVALALVAVAVLATRELRRAKLVTSFFSFLIVLAVVLSSTFVAASVPLGLQYYRFAAYILLLSLPLFAAAPLAVIKQAADSRWHVMLAPVARVIVLATSLSCFLATTQLPNPSHVRLQRLDPSEHYRYETTVLDYFRERQPSGRIYFELFDNPDRFPMASPHYLPARVYEETGWETLNGLFIQSSLAYQMPAASAEQLGLRTYGAPYHLEQKQPLRDETAIAHLRSFGVTHLVLSEPQALQRIEPWRIGGPVSIGPFHIVQIAERPTEIVQPISTPLVGYLDLAGTLPFKLLELYCFARDALAGMELLAIPPDGVLPSEVMMLIVNGGAGNPEPLRTILQRSSAAGLDRPAPPRLLQLHYRPSRVVDRDGSGTPLNEEEREYRRVARYLDSALQFSAPVSQRGERAVSQDQLRPSFEWTSGRQAFRLGDLEPRRLVRVNYTYFPLWRSADGLIYRGSGERIYFLPNARVAEVKYEPFSSATLRAGALTTAFAAIFLLARRLCLR